MNLTNTLSRVDIVLIHGDSSPRYAIHSVSQHQTNTLSWVAIALIHGDNSPQYTVHPVSAHQTNTLNWVSWRQQSTYTIHPVIVHQTNTLNQVSWRQQSTYTVHPVIVHFSKYQFSQYQIWILENMVSLFYKVFGFTPIKVQFTVFCTSGRHTYVQKLGGRNFRPDHKIRNAQICVIFFKLIKRKSELPLTNYVF